MVKRCASTAIGTRIVVAQKFATMDDSLDEEYYADILKENLEEYQFLVMEQQS
mgnify:CR=1 FL=1